MKTRASLQALLSALPGVEKVYFQPPNNLKMAYPCVVYETDKTSVEHADNVPALTKMGYSVTVIDQNADSPITAELLTWPLCSFDRSFRSDNLYHDVFTIFH